MTKPPMPEPAPIQYIRWEAHKRFHAVYFEAAPGEYQLVMTYCARTVQRSTVPHWSYSPAAVCQACRARMKRPWLIPDVLVEAKEAAKKWTKKTCQDSAAFAPKH